MIIDGVGYPAVGSICGTENAAIAQSCGVHGVVVPVVGSSGAGHAVDSCNLNANYFSSKKGIRVLGAIFNKLSLNDDDYYSLTKCRQQVTLYFTQYLAQQQQEAFGFVPLFSAFSNKDEDPMNHVDEFVTLFSKYVNVKGIVDSASKQIQRGPSTRVLSAPCGGALTELYAKVAKTDHHHTTIANTTLPDSNKSGGSSSISTREEIAAKAAKLGAITSC